MKKISELGIMTFSIIIENIYIFDKYRKSQIFFKQNFVAERRGEASEKRGPKGRDEGAKPLRSGRAKRAKKHI